MNNQFDKTLEARFNEIFGNPVNERGISQVVRPIQASECNHKYTTCMHCVDHDSIFKPLKYLAELNQRK